MQFTDLNKLVRLFLLGSFVALLILLCLPDLLKFVAAAGIDKESFTIPLGLICLGFVVALGCIVEGIAQCTLAKYIQRSIDLPGRASFYRQDEEVARVNDWQVTFEMASSREGRFPAECLAIARQPKSLAAAIFHKTAPAEHVKYADAHYGVFMLGSGVAVLCLFLPFPVGRLLINSSLEPLRMILAWLGAVVVSLCCAYALTSLALFNYLYVWEATFRYGCLWLWENPLNQDAKDGTKAQQHNPAPRRQ